MSTLKVQSVQHASAASPAITLDANGQATLNGLAFPTSGSLSGRNRIINGDMRIDQRNVGASVTNGAADTYTVDRFFAYGNQASKFTVQRNAGSVTPPVGFLNYLGTTSLSAYSVPTAETYSINQRVEGFNVDDLNWGTANARAVTLSFWARSSLTGTFGGYLNNGTFNRYYAFSYSISAANTWEYKTITIVGDTSGTWNGSTGAGVNVGWSLGAGSTYSGTGGVWGSAPLLSVPGAVSVVGTNGATFYITGVQLEAGTVATPFERRSYGQELSLCQRYYQYDPYIIWSGNVTSGVVYYSYKTLVVPMRATPAVVYANIGGNNFPATASTVNQSTFQQVSSQRTANGTGAGNFVDSITMSAEL